MSAYGQKSKFFLIYVAEACINKSFLDFDPMAGLFSRPGWRWSKGETSPVLAGISGKPVKY